MRGTVERSIQQKKIKIERSNATQEFAGMLSFDVLCQWPENRDNEVRGFWELETGGTKKSFFKNQVSRDLSK